MTVSELIEQLQALPGELDVMADDAENGRYHILEAVVDDYYLTLPVHVVVK